MAMIKTKSAPVTGIPPSMEIEAPGPLGALRGLLTRVPDRDAPVVLIIPGSGPTDRDGNSPLGIKAAPYLLLAKEIAAAGVSSVRIDKRGLFSSKDAVADPNDVTVEDYVADMRAWIDAVCEATGQRGVWLLGHSEGGLVALAAAQQAKSVCGVILVATPGRPLGDVIKAQLRNNPANTPLLAEADAIIDALAAGERVEAVPTPLAPLFAPAVQGFLISAFSIDPAKLARGIEMPLLIVQGECDLQVGVEDALRLDAAAPGAALVRLPETNHVLKRAVANDVMANLATYADPTLPLAAGVTDAIVTFIEAHT
jgi:uncharacterized protein